MKCAHDDSRDWKRQISSAGTVIGTVREHLISLFIAIMNGNSDWLRVTNVARIPADYPWAYIYIMHIITYGGCRPGPVTG